MFGFWNNDSITNQLLLENTELKRINAQLHIHFDSVHNNCKTMIESNKVLIEKCRILTLKQQLINSEDSELIQKLQEANEIIISQQKRIKSLESRL
jgi:predicted nucleic-acid-binding protein